LGRFRAAKNVFDIDSVQLLQTFADLSAGGPIVGEEGLEGAGSVCLGAAASPLADPVEMQVARVAKKVSAGAKFLITEPVFDIERFEVWFEEVRRRGLHEEVAIVVGIRSLGDAAAASAFARQQPSSGVPESVLSRITSKADGSAQRAAGIEIAVETTKRLSERSGLRGFQICDDGDTDATLEIIEKSELGID
jgi:methylenetetrahydrofolate reductase (NADPH)